MATDPTQDQQVTDRPGQVAPVPVPPGLQAAPTASQFEGWDKLYVKQGEPTPAGWKTFTGVAGETEPTHPMLTPNGDRSGDVPLSQMAPARAQGHHVAIPMQAPAPDNRQGWVPLHNAMAALKAGFQHVGQYKQAMDSALDAVRNGRSDIANAAADAIAKHTANYDSMPPEIQNDLKEMVGMGVGFFTGGAMAPGPKGKEARKIEKGTPEQPLTSTLPPVGAIGELEPSEPAMQLGRVPEKPVPVERQLAGEPGPRTLEAKAVEPGVYEAAPVGAKEIIPWHNQAAKAVENGEGFSFHPVTGEAPTDGHMVEISPEHRETLDHPATAEDIRNFTERNKEVLNAHPNMYVGGYQNELNVSAKVPDRDAAVVLAKKLDQQSVWDVKNQNEIKTGGTGKQFIFPDYPLDQRLNDAGLKPAQMQTAEVRVPPERTTGVHDAAIKAAGAVPGGIQKGDAELKIPDYAMFHDPQSGSSLMLPVDKVTPEAVTRELEKSRAQYAAAEARKVSTAELSTENYHPELQKVIAQTKSLTDDASQIKSRAAFITPDGQFSYLRGGEQHRGVIGKGQMVEPAEGGGYTDPRIDFINQTGVIRTRFETGREGDTLHISVPKTGVSDEQITAIQKSVAQLGRHGNLVLETADNPSLVKSTTKEFVRPSDVEPMLREIGAHPEQSTILTAERQVPLKEPYKIEVIDPTGNKHSETIQAFSVQDARKTVTKQFPDASSYRLESFGERTPSSEYSVPTGKHLSMPESGNRTSEDTIHHELGHAMVGQKEGMLQKGMLRHTHVDLSRGMVRAAVRWDASDLYAGGQPRPEKVPNLIRTFMGGIAAEEVRGLPRSANHNFDPLRVDSDGAGALRILLNAGYDTSRALDIMHQAIDANKEYLTHPAVRGVIEENAPYREPDLSRQYHFSPERLSNMHAEVQRRIQSEKPTEAWTGLSDYGTTHGENIPGREANVAGGEGAGAPEVGRGISTKEITPSLITRALTEKVQKATRPSVTGSTVKLMDNPLPIKGTGEGGAPTTVDVAQALSKYTKSKLPSLELGDAKPALMTKRGAVLAEDEAKYQLAQNNSGEDWYKSDMAEHDNQMQSIRPELKDPTKMSLFKWSEAILSSGHKPSTNAKQALQNWDVYRETGKFSPLNANFDPNQPISDDNRASWGPRSASGYGHAMNSLNRLIAEKGEKGAVDWLHAEHPLSELRQWREPTQTPVRGKVTDIQPGYMILGAKRGPFGANLHGLETKFTADQWVSRTWNRWMGTIEIDPKTGEMQTDSPRNSTERNLMQQSFQAAATKLGKSLSATQAVLWYYEQALYTAHGVPKESWNFADAAKRVAQEDRKSTEFNPAEYEAKPAEKTPTSAWDIIKTLPARWPKSKK